MTGALRMDKTIEHQFEPRDRSWQHSTSTCALPSGGRWRRACSSAQVVQTNGAVRKSSCSHRGRVVPAPSSPPCCNARRRSRGWRLVRPRADLPRRTCGATQTWRPSTSRTSRGTTVPSPDGRTTVVAQHARRAKRRPGLYPTLVVPASTTGARPKLPRDASRAVAVLTRSISRSAGAAPTHVAHPPARSNTLRSTSTIATPARIGNCANDSRRAAAGPRDRQAGEVVSQRRQAASACRRKKPPQRPARSTGSFTVVASTARTWNARRRG